MPGRGLAAPRAACSPFRPRSGNAGALLPRPDDKPCAPQPARPPAGTSTPTASTARHTGAQHRPACSRLIVTRPPARPPARRYFHAYRIDHVLGFFRIWELPGDAASGILGRFRPSIPLARHVRRAPRAAGRRGAARSGAAPLGRAARRAAGLALPARARAASFLLPSSNAGPAPAPHPVLSFFHHHGSRAGAGGARRLSVTWHGIPLPELMHAPLALPPARRSWRGAASGTLTACASPGSPTRWAAAGLLLGCWAVLGWAGLRCSVLRCAALCCAVLDWIRLAA